MGIQTQDLVMVGLSSLNDQSPNSIQPKIVDGIHLRWAFKRSRGFPWYGYYLFRRPNRGADIERESLNIATLNIPSGATAVKFSDGKWSSDSSLRLTIFNSSAGPQTGLDLSGRSFLRFALPERSNQIRLSIGFLQDAEIKITALLQKVPVVVYKVKGQAGQIIGGIALESDAMSSIEFSGGQAVLLELSFLPVAEDILNGWEDIPNCTYPICLPVAHPDYPCTDAPTSQVEAAQVALSRIRYGKPKYWAGSNFANLHRELINLVDGGPSSQPMAEKFNQVASSSPSGPIMSHQYPLDLLLLGAMHPAVAQMLGLSWVDDQVMPGDVYDYLIVAAHKDSLGTTATDALQWLNDKGFDDVDAYIVFNKSIDQPSPPLGVPTGLKVYALPNIPMIPETGAVAPHDNNAGLRWDLGKVGQDVLLPERPVMYHVWRAELGNEQPPNSTNGYMPLTRDRPIIVVDSAATAGNRPSLSATWPPARLYFLDTALPNGWYGYQVSAIDIFGRHSQNSPAGAWYQWFPAPEPKPWYFKDPPPSDLIVHQSAVLLRDTAPPPPPTGVEAWALDPDDPTVLRDQAYQTWWSMLIESAWYQALTDDQRKNLIGLRVRWRWTAEQMEQAPDIREFRIYFHDKPMNVMLGKVRSVTPVSVAESDVTTDISNNMPVDAYKGLWLRSCLKT